MATALLEQGGRDAVRYLPPCTGKIYSSSTDMRIGSGLGAHTEAF